MSSDRPSATSTSSLSFKARELKFCKQAPYINAKKLLRRFLKFHYEGVLWGFFQTSLVRPSTPHGFTQLRYLCAMFQLSGFKTEEGDWGDRRRRMD